MLFSILSGYLFVRFGRRKVILISFAIGITALLSIPFVGKEIYP